MVACLCAWAPIGQASKLVAATARILGSNATVTIDGLPDLACDERLCPKLGDDVMACVESGVSESDGNDQREKRLENCLPDTNLVWAEEATGRAIPAETRGKLLARLLGRATFCFQRLIGSAPLRLERSSQGRPPSRDHSRGARLYTPQSPSAGGRVGSALVQSDIVVRYARAPDRRRGSGRVRDRRR